MRRAERPEEGKRKTRKTELQSGSGKPRNNHSQMGPETWYGVCGGRRRTGLRVGPGRNGTSGGPSPGPLSRGRLSAFTPLSRAGSGPLRLLGSPMEVSVAEPQRWEQQTSMQAISILSFSFFPFPNRFGDILVSNLNMGIDYQIRRMWMLFGSICIFSNVYWLDLHNKTRVVLANL